MEDRNDEKPAELFGEFTRRGEHPLALRRQLRMSIGIALSVAPKWLFKQAQDGNDLIRRSAHAELAERVARAIEGYEIRFPGDTVTDPSLPPPAYRTGENA